MRGRWADLAGVAVLVGLFVVLLPRPFPTGADPGHMVAIARGVGDPGRYPPLVPWLMQGVVLLAGGDTGRLLLGVKVVAVASLGAAAWGHRALATVLTDDPRVPPLAFLLAAANPVAIYEILWGGLAQFWGMALGLLALAHLLRWRATRRHRIAGVLLGAAATYAHWYAALFAAAAGAAVVAATRPWRSPETRREFALAALPGGLLAAPMVLAYLDASSHMRTFPDPATLVTTAYLPGLAGVPAARPSLAVVSLLLVGLALVLLGRHGLPQAARSPKVTAWVAAGGVGFLVLLAVTPATFAERPFYFLPVVLIPLLATVLGGFWEVPLRDPVATGPVVAALAMLLATAGLAHAAQDVRYFGPLDADARDAMVELGRDPGAGGIAVYSSFPNVDAWWLEALSGRPAASSDLARYFVYQDEVDRMQVLRRVGAGELSGDAGDVVLALSPHRGLPAPATLLVKEEGDLYPLLELREDASVLETMQGEHVPLRPDGIPTTLHRRGFGVTETWRTATGLVERTIRVTDQGVHVAYEVPEGTRHVHLLLAAGNAGGFRAGGDELHHRWFHGGHDRSLHVRPWPPESTSTTALSLQLDVAEGRALLRVDPQDVDLRPVGRLRPAAELLREAGIRSIYLRDVPPGLEARFHGDPLLTLVGNHGPDVRTFQLEDAR